MRSLWTVLAFLAALSGAAHAQTLSMPCSTAGAFCGKLVSPACLDKVGAGATGLGGGSDACGENLDLYRECLATVAASCGPAAQAPTPLTRTTAAGQTLTLNGGDEVTLRGCALKGGLVACELTLHVAADKSVQFCSDVFGLILQNGDQINASAAIVPGREGFVCPSPKLFAVAPARFQLEFNAAGAAAGQEVKVIAFNSLLFDGVILK